MRLFPEISFFLDANVLRVKYRSLTALAACNVIIQAPDCRAAKNQNGRHVDYDDHTLQHIRSIPDQTGVCNRTDEHDGRSKQAEEEQLMLFDAAMQDELQTALELLVVAEKRGESEQHNRYCQEHRTYRAERGCDSILYINRTGDFLGRNNIG